MSQPLDLQVDEDGFVCVVSPDFYSGFVDEDWSLDQLLAHFVQQSNLGSLFVAYPGPDHADAPLTFDEVAESGEPYRRATGVVKVGPQGLWLTDYTQLTMAAQFQDSAPIDRGAVRLPVREGTYLLTLIHMSGEGAEFHLSSAPGTPTMTSRISSVPWFSY
ncbi:hypothetical protein [Psychromicrobium xiongbiense]|uniref:hypothetical protein n=1 Tax=Psychromicrobium xiongbiense TaxID=3051184 RepID=UPI00255522DB|nr:hypothetical protein [Psychromicrobium sp. YIM S02556]